MHFPQYNHTAKCRIAFVFYDRILRILIDDLNFAEYSISFVDAVNTLQRNRFSNLIRCGGILCTKYISIIKSGHVDVIFDRIIIFIIDLLIDRGVYQILSPAVRYHPA